MSTSPPGRPTVWPAFLAYTAAFILLVAADAALFAIPAALMMLAWRSQGGAEATLESASAVELSVRAFAGSAFGVAALSAMNATVLASVAIVTQSFAPTHGLREGLRLGRARLRTGVLVFAVVGFWGLALACGAVANLAGVGENGNLGFLDRALHGASPPALVLAVVGIGIFPGAGEEAFFRGMMLTRLRGRLRPWPAIVVTALAFGFIHLDLVQGTFAVLLGLYLGWLVERAGSARPAMIAHALNNAFFVLAAGVSRSDSTGAPSSYAALIAGGLGACAFGVWLVSRSKGG
jgi:membrane protease YdiL (CAAX protease family)